MYSEYLTQKHDDFKCSLVACVVIFFTNAQNFYGVCKGTNSKQHDTEMQRGSINYFKYLTSNRTVKFQIKLMLRHTIYMTHVNMQTQ